MEYDPKEGIVFKNVDVNKVYSKSLRLLNPLNIAVQFTLVVNTLIDYLPSDFCSFRIPYRVFPIADLVSSPKSCNLRVVKALPLVSAL